MKLILLLLWYMFHFFISVFNFNFNRSFWCILIKQVLFHTSFEFSLFKKSKINSSDLNLLSELHISAYIYITFEQFHLNVYRYPKVRMWTILTILSLFHTTKGTQK